MFDGWVVERNIVRVDHWHGISLYGAVNSIIRDNIVTDPNGRSGIGPPWIMVNRHKNGSVSRNSEITCNISPKLLILDRIGLLGQHNTLSETGGPGNHKCIPLAPASPYLQLLLKK